jgi:hypothetical protein
MDKQVLAVVLSFALYALYVLLPMVPAMVLYRMFPDTKVSASGVLANLNFKTTGAFAAYVVTVTLGFFLVQNTHHQITQMSNPVWTLKAEVDLLNQDGTQFTNGLLIETLKVSIDPELQRINGNKVILSLPGLKRTWEKTQLTFYIPNFGHYILDLSEASENAYIDEYDLLIKLNDPVIIKAAPQLFNEYSDNEFTESLVPSSIGGPDLRH